MRARERSLRGDVGRAAIVLVVIIVLAAVGALLVLRREADTTAEQRSEPKAAGPIKEITLAPGVYLNKDYDRLNSKLLVRRVVGPTRARLDFAAYDANTMLLDPKMYEPAPPEKPVTLKDLDFNGALGKETLCDRVENTPLTAEEKANPMAWRPMTEYLALQWTGGDSRELEMVGAAVSEVKWNDPDVIPAYQEIARAYLHKGEGGYEMWVKVEFKPWVKFVEGVDDEDGDKFPEYYGRVKQGVVTREMADFLLSEYAGKPLDYPQIKDWAYELGSYWYPQYKTYTRRPEPLETGMQMEGAKADDDDKVLAGLSEAPVVMIRGAPFEEYIYLVLYVNTPK